MLTLALAASLALTGAAQNVAPVDIDITLIRKALAAAAPEGQGAGAVVALPLRDGSFRHFAAWESPVMAPGLAERYPSIRTYVAQGLDEPDSIARIDLNHNGLHAMILRGGEGVLVSAVPGDEGRVTVRLAGEDREFWECVLHAAPDEHDDGYDDRGPTPLRTYRFAIACTAEFAADASAAQGRAPNVPDALAAVVTLVNRANLLLERDVAVRLEMVANNDALMYLDPDTDPYSPTDSGANLGANISTLGNVIGNANFDLGHVITRIPGGVAYLRAACANNIKAGGVSGLPRTDTGDPFDPQVLMHEVGHQLGANHTFNGNVDRCLSNRNANTAWEPGSGTSILSYAGGCPVGNVPPGDNIVVNRDIMYHVGSLLEMRSFLAGGGAGCGTPTVTGNTPPAFTSLPPTTGRMIPRLTPFVVNAAATDVDGDSITYSWEQFDRGPQQSLTGSDSADNGTSPLFRVFAPRASGERVFPQWADILSGTMTPGERLPEVAPATRKFRVVARDNRAGAGGVTISPTIEVQVVAGTGPFEVTSAGASWPRLGVYTLRWNAAGVADPPLGVQTVAVDLLTDDGSPLETLATSVPTNAQVIAIAQPPGLDMGAVYRFRVRADTFFAVSGPVVAMACDPDYNADGVADQEDVSRLIECIASGPSCVVDPDFDGNGVADQDDVAALIHHIAGGPCPA